MRKMSLFNLREIWSVSLNISELINNNSLIFKEFYSKSYLFIASHDGYLRCFSPDIKNPASYSVADLVYETLFDSPVLQLQFASLVSGSLEKQLAVLHPRSIAIYHIQLTENGDSSGISLRHAYQHSLHRAAHSFVTGPFGNIKGRDFLCVQSLDGLLSFFEQESPTFETQLPDILLPGPISYLKSVDGFVLQDANQVLLCYTYESLSEADRKKITAHWSHNIGDYILDMNCLNLPEIGMNIMVLTERNIYNFTDKGAIIWMKKLEARPLCIFNYLNHTTNKIISLLCTEFQTLQVYEGTSLKWSAKLDFIPISITVCNIGSMRGILTLLSDSGTISLSYMGTIPSLYLIPPTTEPDINIQQAEEELKFLQQEITTTDFIGNFAEDILSVTLTVDQQVTRIGNRSMCKVSVELYPQVPINKVQIFFVAEYPLATTPSSTIVSSVCKKENVDCNVYVDYTGALSSLDITAVVSYLSSSGIPRVIQKSGKLPLEIATVTCPPSKDAAFKLTLGTNKPTCPLSDLFPGEDVSANAVGICFPYENNTVSIITAKTSQRYRLQADRVEDVALILEILTQRLQQFYRKTPDFALTVGSPLPLQAYFENVEKHYESITRKRLKREQLAQRSGQYRTIQKKVLIALKDLAPKPTSAMHKVLDDTFAMMKITIDELEELENELQTSRCRLSSISRLIVNMLKLMTVKTLDMAELHLVFSPVNNDNDEQGWLEVQNATLNLFMRTTFAKSSKDQNKSMELTLEPLSDVSRLCKNFAAIIDRATTGTSLLERAEFENQNDIMPTVPSKKKWQEREDKLVPAGSKLVDLSAISKNSKQHPVHNSVDDELLGIATADASPLVPVVAEVTIETIIREEMKNSLSDHDDLQDEENAEVNIPLPSSLIEDSPKDMETTPENMTQDVEKPMKLNKRIPNNVEDDDMWDLDLDEMRI